MGKILQQLCRIGIVPIVSVEDVGKAVGLANALTAGGIPAAEVTLRIRAGEEATRLITENCPQVLVGADTILNVGQCQWVLSAGARFIVSPGCNEDLVSYCLGLNIPVIPGCANTSDLGRAVTVDPEMIKSFPAEQVDGPPALKALAPVFPRPSFMPTGGVSIKNLSGHLGYDRVRLCGGSWMAKSELTGGEQWDEITTLCRQAMGVMLDSTLQHMDLPCGNADAAASTAWAICRFFGLEYRQGDTSDSAVSFVGCCKAELSGTHRHTAIGTPDVKRAEFHPDLQGTEFPGHTREVDDKGRAKAIYLNQAFVDFTVYLMRKQRDSGKELFIWKKSLPSEK